jgi:hypothetical protein
MTATLDPAAAPAQAPARPRPAVLAATSGIAFTVLSFIPTVPELPAEITAQSARAYLVDNAATLRTFGILMAVTAAVLLVFVAHLRALMTQAEGGRGHLADVAYGSGVVVAVWLVVSGAMNSIGGFDIADTLPDAFVVQYVGLAAVGDMIGSATTVLKGTLMLAVSLVALRTRFLPRWLGWFGAVLGAMAIGGAFTFTDNPVTGALFYAGLFGFALWPLPVGIVLTVKAIRARRAG